MYAAAIYVGVTDFFFNISIFFPIKSCPRRFSADSLQGFLDRTLISRACEARDIDHIAGGKRDFFILSDVWYCDPLGL